jgi:hypothetical protein
MSELPNHETLPPSVVARVFKVCASFENGVICNQFRPLVQIHRNANS